MDVAGEERTDGARDTTAKDWPRLAGFVFLKIAAGFAMLATMTDDIPTISANSKPYGQRSPSNRRALCMRLTREERNRLEGVLTTRSARKSHKLRATILLMSDDGVASGEIARFLTVTPGTVAGWRSLYARHGIDTVLAIAPRRNDKRKHRPNVDAAILALALAEPPCGCRWWTYRQIATYVEGVSVAYVSQVVRRAGIDLRAGRRPVYKY